MRYPSSCVDGSARSRSASWSPGDPRLTAPSPKQPAAASITAHRSALLSREVARSSDLVVVMSPEQAAAVRASFTREALVVVLGDLDPLPIESRTIRDPWGCGDEVFASSFARIERCVQALASAVAKGDATERG